MARVRAFVVLAAAVLLVSPGTAQKDPLAADLLRAANEYLASYAPRVSGISLEEMYTLVQLSGGTVAARQRIKSDVVLVNLAGRIVGLRDPFAVDEKPLRERTPRLTSVLAQPSEAAWARALSYTNESIRFFMDELIVRLHEPTLALQFIALPSQARVTYKVEGRKRIEGVEAVVLRFQEINVKPPDYIIETPGKAAASGRLWVDPANGRIHRTELWMQSPSESAHIVVDYQRDPRLDLLLPSSMVDTYDVSETVATGVSNMSPGGTGTPGRSGTAHRLYEGRASYSNARLTPIDMGLTK